MEEHDVSFLRKQESRLLMPSKSSSPGLALGQDGLSRLGRGELLHSANLTVSTGIGPYQI